MLRMNFVKICSGVVERGIRAQPVRIKNPVTVVGYILSVVSTFLNFGFNSTEVVCVFG